MLYTSFQSSQLLSKYFPCMFKSYRCFLKVSVFSQLSNKFVITIFLIYFSGENPIQTTCKQNTGTTIVGEEIQGILEACEGDGCSKITFDYGVSMNQMKTLIDVSQFCHQKLSFECFGSPLKIGSKNIGYWLDRQGKILSLFLKYKFLPLSIDNVLLIDILFLKF